MNGIEEKILRLRKELDNQENLEKIRATVLNLKIKNYMSKFKEGRKINLFTGICLNIILKARKHLPF